MFGLSRDIIRETGSNHVLDYGGGDGAFARSCIDLGLADITVYEPSVGFAKLARERCNLAEQISIFQKWSDVRTDRFDVVTMHAVWMCLKTEDECAETLERIAAALISNGILVAAVTHPCFRESRFSSYVSDFQNENYLDDGRNYRVTMTDGQHSLSFVDTHWTLGAMSRQLQRAGFSIERLFEVPDAVSDLKGCPWLTIVARKSEK